MDLEANTIPTFLVDGITWLGLLAAFVTVMAGAGKMALGRQGGGGLVAGGNGYRGTRRRCTVRAP